MTIVAAYAAVHELPYVVLLLSIVSTLFLCRSTVIADAAASSVRRSRCSPSAHRCMSNGSSSRALVSRFGAGASASARSRRKPTRPPLGATPSRRGPRRPRCWTLTRMRLPAPTPPPVRARASPSADTCAHDGARVPGGHCRARARAMAVLAPVVPGPRPGAVPGGPARLWLAAALQDYKLFD